VSTWSWPVMWAMWEQPANTNVSSDHMMKQMPHQHASSTGEGGFECPTWHSNGEIAPTVSIRCPEGPYKLCRDNSTNENRKKRARIQGQHGVGENRRDTETQAMHMKSNWNSTSHRYHVFLSPPLIQVFRLSLYWSWGSLMVMLQGEGQIQSLWARLGLSYSNLVHFSG